MQPQFKPPASEEEFEKRADEMTIEGAKGVLAARKRQREAAVKVFEDEIKFLEKVLKHKGVTL
jgi:hypothetical protein